MARSLIAQQLTWGGRQYSDHLALRDLELDLSPDVEADTRDALSTIDLPSVVGAADLMADNPAAVQDDFGINRLVILNRGSNVVFKRMRSHRVPTIYHEPFVANIVAQTGVRTLDYLGIARGIDGSQWILTRYLPEHVTIRDLLSNMDSEEEPREQSSSRNRGHLNYCMYTFALSLRRLVQAGIQYADVDFKNALAHVKHNNPVILYDFERTRILNSTATTAAIALATPIARRMDRQKLDQSSLRMLSSGIFFDPVSISVADLASWLINLIRPGRASPFIVAIDGMAGSGKTTLAKSLAREIEGVGRNTMTVETDWFIRYGRSERSVESFSIPHTSWYDLALLKAELRKLKSREGGYFRLPLYDHGTGLHSLIPPLFEDPEIIILEGMYSGDQLLSGTTDLVIHMSAAPSLASRRFRGRDKARASSDNAEAFKRERQINSARSRARIGGSSSSAHLTLDGGAGFRYRIIAGRAELVPSLVGYAVLEEAEADSKSCVLCPTSATGIRRFHVEGNCQAIRHPAPVVAGHVLVAPLRHVGSLDQLDDGTRMELFSYAFEITRFVMQEMEASAFDWLLRDGRSSNPISRHLHIDILPYGSEETTRPIQP